MTLLSRLSTWWASRREAAAPAARTAAPIASAPAPAPPAAAPPKSVEDHPGGTLGYLAEALNAPAPASAHVPVHGMRIEAHRLRGVAFDASPHVGGVMVPRFIVMHYTAGGTAANSVRAIRDRGLSAHFFVDRDGTIIQTVPCNRAAYHAGESSWQGYSGLNGHSIGIEISNLGWFDQREGAGWVRDGLSRVMRADQVVVVAHKNGGKAMAWETYPAAQMLAVADLTRAILAAYPTIRDVVGHDDVSPRRKVDPGPAFPLARFRGLLPG